MTMISFNFDCDALYQYRDNSHLNLGENNRILNKDRFSYYEDQLNQLKDAFDAKEKSLGI